MKKIMQTPVLVTRTFAHQNIIATSASSGPQAVYDQQIDMSEEAQKAAAAKNGGVAVTAYGIQW